MLATPVYHSSHPIGYINAVLQCLFAIPAFVHYLTNFPVFPNHAIIKTTLEEYCMGNATAAPLEIALTKVKEDFMTGSMPDALLAFSTLLLLMQKDHHWETLSWEEQLSTPVGQLFGSITVSRCMGLVHYIRRLLQMQLLFLGQGVRRPLQARYRTHRPHPF